MSSKQYKHLSTFVSSLPKLNEQDGLWAALVKCLDMIGAYGSLYLHSNSASSLNFDERILLNHGVSPEWISEYYRDKLYQYDPYVPYLSYACEPFKLSDIGKLTTLTPEQERFLATMQENVPYDGFIIPVFGAAGQSGRCSVLFSPSTPDDEESIINVLQWACQAFHNRLCAINIRKNSFNMELEPREEDVLQWMLKGKDAKTISLVTGQSLASLKVTISQMQKKMQVSNHQAALEFAFMAGLIQPQP